MKPLNILIVEDSENDAILLLLHLKRSGYEVHHIQVQTEEDMKSALASQEFDIVLSDYQMPHFSGLEAFKTLQESKIDIPFIILSGTIGEETAVNAMIAGVSDYMMKSNLSRLAPAIERELQEAENRRAKRNAEKSLKRSEESYRDLFENANDTIFTVDLNGNFMSINKKGEELTGYSREELLLTNFSVIFSDEDLQKLRAMMLKKLSGADSTTRYEINILTKDKSKKSIEINSRIIYKDNSPIGIQGIARDITKRKNLENDLRESEKRLNLALSAAEMGVWEWNLLNDEVYWSPECYKVLNISGKIENLSDFQKIVHPEDYEIVMREVLRAIKNQEIYSMEFRIVNSQNDVVWAANRALTEYDDSGSPKRVIGTVNDITSRKKAEKDLFESEEKLRQAQKLESIGRLAGGIAHDFNNMLTAISGYSELSLRLLDENNPIRCYIHEIKSAGERAALMTAQLLAFSRRQIIKPQVLNINEVIGEMFDFTQRLIGEDIKLVWELKPDIGQIEADPGQMSQLIMNLAVNSRDAMPEGGMIKIETDNVYLDEEYSRKNAEIKVGNYVLVRISDSGSGISEDILEYIFDPFFTTKEVGKGTGLGLSTVYGIVNQSGGHIDVQSIVGEGTIFEIYLPRIDDEVTQNKINISLQSSLKGNETILVVEDEEMVRKLMQEILKSYGYNIITAQNGEAALEICKTNNDIDMLITDIVMPKMGGYELAENLKKIQRQIPVLFTSGYTEDSKIKYDLIDSNVDFINKPFNAETLTSKVREILETKKNSE